MNLIKTSISGILLLALIISLNTKFGAVPPLGKFFDPESGFWANAEISEPESEVLDIPGLEEEVSVYFDERRVPHIFARNERDLFLAQGYIVARDRLFQMEMQTYDAAGRLAEIVGADLINRDLNTRRLGMVYGAEKAFEEIRKDSEMLAVAQAYADGVNAWIDQLSQAEYPVEYKVLDFAPEKWHAAKTAYLLKNMTRTLAGGHNDVRTSNTIRYFGEDFVEKYFTQKPELNDPIIPPSREWDFEADVPEAPDSLFVSGVSKVIDPFPHQEGIGSNNWVVSGEKTASGYPILANDPHLGLTLPSIWYEMQLNAPGYNSYGVTLQGSPAIIVGFNEQSAWGTTNVGSDVMDWYEIKFRDETKQEYWHDGQWKPTTSRVEEIKVRGRETVLDTVIYTHHGPVFEVDSAVGEDEPVYHALKWIAHEPSNDLRTFYGFNKMQNYDDYIEAVNNYTAPAQNFVFADATGDIALWVSGKLPQKWKFQGRTVSDGTDPVYDWQGWIPTGHNPHIKNPERGFVSSANQESAAPDYPYYLDDDFAPYERGRRINDLLAEMENITPQDMQRMQLDNFAYNASNIIPQMIEWTRLEELSEQEVEILEIIRNWDFMMAAELIQPTVYLSWFNKFYREVFYDEFNGTEASLRYPSRDIFVEIIKEEPNMAFVDDIITKEEEVLEDIVTRSYKETISRLTRMYGEDSENWKWGYDIDNDLNHIANIPGLGAQNLFSSGSAEAINAVRGTHGPSWRMIVELGPEVKGWGVYPGGQSGNPGSPNYDSMVEPWLSGELFELNFLKEEPSEFYYKIEMNPGK
ncbi:MAG: penicillin acylase family protein [Gracilimonas sp.]|uniref:penicillin acylase family protein n=1 Tax=Gracilimonas sp. TaxID=1974203 RepID=UPI0019AED50C|nr:penicillin acylase family protein [Gracilimonas sp.]MBD3617383.1 penicillin acylase family protein [Gracilimonas sp.]